MYDFKDSISLKRMMENISFNNESFQKLAEPFLYNVYFRILEYSTLKGYVHEVISIQTEYFENKVMFASSNYERDKLALKRKVMQDLRLDTDIVLKEKNDQYAIVNCLLNEYKRLLNMEIGKYRKEDVLVLIYSISSMISYISTMSVYLYKHNVKDVSKSDKYTSLANLIVDTLGVLYEKENIWIQGLLGYLKKSSEYLINYLLHSEANNIVSKISEIDIMRIYIIVDCIIDLINVKKSIEPLSKMGFQLKIHGGLLQMDEQMISKFVSYSNNLTDNTLDVDSLNARKLIQEFEHIEGYSPKIIEDYVYKLKDKNLIIEASLNLVEDKFLYIDLVLSTGYDYDSIYKIIETISLKRCEDVDMSIFSSDNRIFRTPIIKVDNYYILSHQLLSEAVAYLRYRVLKNKFTTKGKFKEKVKENYDEFELKELRKLVLDNNLIGGINLNVEKLSFIKPYLNNKGISKEIDFYFVYKNVLYTMEYKNQDIDNNLYEVCRSYSRNIKNKSKHLRLIEILKNNITHLEEELNTRIVQIRSFLVFKKKNSFSEFYQGGEIYVCSYSDFLDFCKELIKYCDFEEAPNGFR
ncbi:Uncharacterised protein [Clostridium sporogenes]|uniref:Uncharacterized protein n=1 Tax=Clostridium sporogenes TaxID=1509 RepID=A0A7U4LN20_CLOSG|nr:hypothetical protein [Clostridium sporogenes]AKC62877.1 hypothetical protein CLSPO_c21570 [Clostridium sporogenes]AKJ90119.1 hypothetical protein CLSPOx_10855 [Clostridium sporogenes]KCZ68255.1 hypothetical protein CSPO_6c02980 [Clostridium sporogenes]OOO65383.1 hypothetical protein BS099_16020 [Clostridium sporogenes]SQC04245.1 Uncharacterised protein [Clostridium sporogenes]